MNWIGWLFFELCESASFIPSHVFFLFKGQVVIKEFSEYLLINLILSSLTRVYQLHWF